MTKLTVYPDDLTAVDIDKAITTSSDPEVITFALDKAGIRFEQWQADFPITKDTGHEQILQAYANDIERLIELEGYQTVDVVSMYKSHPEREAFRQKFLFEHRHTEDEVRFFVNGCGLFCLHIDERVYQVLCEKGDLISVPANTPHWFDMGSEPEFTAIRLFNNAEGWVAHASGEDIASAFPLLD